MRKRACVSGFGSRRVFVDPYTSAARARTTARRAMAETDLLSAADLGLADPAGTADDAPNSRSRWRVSAHETNVLEAVFASSPRPNKNTIHQLATMLGVKPRQVQVWFQNRRQRWRKDFLELERARTMQLAELSGKVIDFHGDLLPLTAGAQAEQAALSMPAGWERLLLAPGAAPADAPGADADAAAASACDSATQMAKAEPGLIERATSSSVGEGSSDGQAELEGLNEMDLCYLLNFPPTKGDASPDCALQPPLPESREHSSSLSLNGSPELKSRSSTEQEESEEDTIWLGMEWLVADSDELMVN